MIVARVNAGLARARHAGTKSGKAIGRPKGANYDRKAIRAALVKGAWCAKRRRRRGASVGLFRAFPDRRWRALFVRAADAGFRVKWLNG